MRRMNYGPRFKGSAVGVGYHYDPYLDKQQFWPPKPGTAKAVFREAKMSAALRKQQRERRDAKAAAQASEYEMAELRLIEEIRLAIGVIEMRLKELNGGRGVQTTKLNRHALIDLVLKMKTKLGMPLSGIKTQTRPSEEEDL